MTDDDEVIEIKNPKLLADILWYAGLGTMIALLILGAYNKGYGDGYNYVNDWKDNYIADNCQCFNRTMPSGPSPTPIQSPIVIYNNVP